MTNIVTVNVNLIQSPVPPTLQKTGAIVSQGGTILSPQQSSLLTQLADLTPLLRGARTLSALSWSSGIVTATTTTAHGLVIGQSILITVIGANPTGYNGTFLCTITTTTQFTYVLAVNPGIATAPGSYTNEAVGELVAMATTFFAQGAAQGVYVWEAGAVDDNDAIAALSSYIVANPNTSYVPGSTGYFYSWLVPRSWDGNANFLAMIADYESTTARTYFFVTTTLASYTNYTTLMKDVVAMIESPQYSAWPANTLTGLTRNSGAATAVEAAAGTGYAPGDVVVLAGGTNTVPAELTVSATQAISATIVAGGTTAHADGSAQVIGTTGTGTKFVLNVTITGGTISAIGGVATAGAYTVNPTAIANEPVAGVSFTITGAVVDVVMGVLSGTVLYPGAYTATPSNPVSQASTTGSGTGATWTVTWTFAGTAVATTTTAHGVQIGDWFQLQGNVPIAWNGYHRALTGTASNTIVFALASDPGAETTLGTLEASLYASTGVTSTEFSLAAPFHHSLNYNPSSSNKVAPFSFARLFGVTPFPSKGNSALLTTLQEANVNYVFTGAEGGLTDTYLFWGRVMSGRDFTYWYSVDYAAINIDINLANEVINGSNNPVNPLYYSQSGIDRLQDRAVATFGNCIAVGLANGSIRRTSLSAADFNAALDAGTYAGYIVVNAEPFTTYLTENPNDYRTGRYAGLSAQYIPNRGFQSIIFNLNVTDFIVA